MIFYLEDNKKWSQLMHFFKTCISGNSNICFMWNNVHGWLLMQNSEYLNNLDSDHLVLLSYFKMSYFSSFVQNRELGMENATFEMDITRIYQSLRSIRKTTKRVMFSLQGKGNQNNYAATFVMKIFDEDGILEIYKDVYLNHNLNQNLYFNHMRNLSQENILYLEIQQNYLKSVKEFKNCILQLKFYEEHIHVEALNGEQDLVLQINKNICTNYNFSRILSQFDNKNRLLIPPNFLISQIYLANKFNQTIQLQFGDEMVGGRVIVYMRVKSESFEIVSAFSTVFDIDDQTQDNTSPFNVNPQIQMDDIQQNNLNNNNNNSYILNTNQINNNNNPLQTYQQINTNSQQQQLPIQNNQITNENQKRINGQQRNENRNGILDQLNSDLNKENVSNNNQQQLHQQQSKLKSNAHQNGQMIDEAEEAAKGSRSVNKKMDIEKLGRQGSADRNGNEDLNAKKQNRNTLNSNQFMEVEAGLEKINLRKLRKNNVVDMVDFENVNNNQDHLMYDESILDDEEEEKNSKSNFQRIENGSKKRGSAVLQHLQEEFSSIELLQENNQNFSSSIALDSRKQTNNQRVQQAGKQRHKNQQENLLQTDGEFTDNNQTQPQQQYNGQKERNKFLTEQKYLPHQQLKKNGVHDVQKQSVIQSNESEVLQAHLHNRKGGLDKNQKVRGDYQQIDLEAFNSQLVYPVYHDDDEMEESSSNDQSGEVPRKHQKLGMLEKRNIQRQTEMEEQYNQNNQQIVPNKNKQSMLKKLSEMQMNLITNNKRTVKEMLQQTSQFGENEQIPETTQQGNQQTINDQLKNKLFHKNNDKQRQEQSRKGSPEVNGKEQQYKFAKPAPVQSRNLFESKKNGNTNNQNNNNNVQNAKRNQEVGDYFASHNVSKQYHQQQQQHNHHHQIDIDNSSFRENEESYSNSGMVMSKLLQRNQENLEELKKEKIMRKAKRTQKQQIGPILNGNHYDNTQSQIEEDGRMESGKGFFQTPFVKKHRNSSPMSQLHSSQKIIQISNDTSESQQTPHKLQNNNIFNNHKQHQNNNYQKEGKKYNNPNYSSEVVDSEKIDKRGIMRIQHIPQHHQHAAAANNVNEKKGFIQQEKDIELERRRGSINNLNSYHNPLETNYHSLNTIQSNQQPMTAGDALNSAVQRDRFEQYQKIHNRERQIANNMKESEITKLHQNNQNGLKSMNGSEIPKNMTSSNRLSESQSFKTCLEQIKPYSFQEPLPRSSKQHNQYQQQQQHLEQQKQTNPVQTESVLSKSMRDNSFDNFLRQNKKKDDFSVFSVKKPSQQSVISQHNQQQEKVGKNGFEFQHQQKIKQEHLTSQSEVSQKLTQNKGMKLFL